MWIKPPDKNLASWLFAKTKDQFTYKSDGKKDKWKVFTGNWNFSGDCDDFAMCLGYRFFNAFWVPLFLGKFELYHVKYNGVGHMMLYCDGYWYDNIMDYPTPASKLPTAYNGLVRYSPWVVLVNCFIWKR